MTQVDCRAVARELSFVVHFVFVVAVVVEFVAAHLMMMIVVVVVDGAINVMRVFVRIRVLVR